MSVKIQKGKLLVIDGPDGSGKATQTKLLVSRLRREGARVRTLDFPQYEKNFFGRFLKECLQGKYGDFPKLDAHIASTLYAADRFESKKKIEQWLKAGYAVILDRYVSANQIHQGGKISDARERGKFLAWLDAMEYKIFGIPRPDMVIYLSVPVEFSLDLLRSEKESDIVESDRAYLENSFRSAEWLSKKQEWVRISCVRKNVMRSIDDIHEEVFSVIKKVL